MTEEEFEKFQQKVENDNLQRRASFKKINKKLDQRHRKKELKKNFEEHTNCITQWIFSHFFSKHHMRTIHTDDKIMLKKLGMSAGKMIL